MRPDSTADRPHPMDLLLDFLGRLLTQFQSPALAFLIGGMLLAACGSKLQIPDAIYKFCVFMLLMRIGLEGGLEIRQADLSEMLLPAIIAFVVGCAIVIVGRFTLARLPGVRTEDGIATAGLFGAVSAPTLAAAMVTLEEQDVGFEARVPAREGPCRCDRSRRPARLGAVGAAAGPAAGPADPSRAGLRRLLRSAVPGLLVDPDADHGHGGLDPAGRTPAGRALVRGLRGAG